MQCRLLLRGVSGGDRLLERKPRALPVMLTFELQEPGFYFHDSSRMRRALCQGRRRTLVRRQPSRTSKKGTGREENLTSRKTQLAKRETCVRKSATAAGSTWPMAQTAKARRRKREPLRRKRERCEVQLP